MTVASFFKTFVNGALHLVGLGGWKKTPDLLEHRRTPGNRAAILFLHGFGGDASKTWGNFPGLLKIDAGLVGWDIFSLGYHTSLRIDIVGIWAAEPDLAVLAVLLKSRATVDPLKVYETLALVAHSMGGLIVQRALLDDAALLRRVGHVFLFGTPSEGLAKAEPGKHLKQQFRDMSSSGDFIKDIRGRWKASFPGALPFKFWAVAGDLDQFVPPESSIGPFPDSQWVVPGNHVSIVKPEDANSPSVRIVVEGITKGAHTMGRGDSARRAVEFREFQKAIDLLWVNRAGLDEDGRVQLALALEGVGRTEDAFEVLEGARPDHTDAMGTLAGRLKRRWLVQRLQADAERAQTLYQQGYDLSVQKGRDDQAFYHGVNVAFMQLLFEKNPQRAQDMAKKVIEHCKAEVTRGKRTLWCNATEAEAHLHLGELQTALTRYREAVQAGPKPRELDAIRTQAVRLAMELGYDEAARELEEILV